LLSAAPPIGSFTCIDVAEARAGSFRLGFPCLRAGYDELVISVFVCAPLIRLALSWIGWKQQTFFAQIAVKMGSG
jgi:hypothetical protein